MSKLISMCLVSTLIQVFGSFELGEKRLGSGVGNARKRQRCNRSPTDDPTTPTLEITPPEPSPQSDLDSAPSEPTQRAQIGDLDPTALGMGILCRKVIESIYEELCTDDWVVPNQHAQIEQMSESGTLGDGQQIYDLLTDLRCIGNACAHHNNEPFVGNLLATCLKISLILDQIEGEAAPLEKNDRDVLENILNEFRLQITNAHSQASIHSLHQDDVRDLRESLETAKMANNELLRDFGAAKTRVNLLQSQLAALQRIQSMESTSALKTALEEVHKLQTQMSELSTMELNRIQIEKLKAGNLG